MSEIFRSAEVYVRDLYAGTLRETDQGYSFVYDPAYLQTDLALPVSITMPLSDGEYFSRTLFAFFDGLIPEGWLLDIASRNWKIDKSDRFGLLLTCCRDCIGDVSVRGKSYEVQ